MKKYVIGFDLGGTNSVLALVDKEGNVSEQVSFKTNEFPDIEQYVKQCTKTITELIQKAGGKEYIAALGIGAPDVNYWSRSIENATNLPWKGIVPLADKIEAKTGIVTFITNDAKAAALGEMLYGAAQGMKDFIMITLGTGVGSGIVVNGELVYGKRSFAGELGHMSIRPENGRICPCGRIGCLEAYCSATGMVRTAIDFLKKSGKESSLHTLPITSITSKDIYDAAMKGDQVAKEIFEYTGKLLGEALANCATFSDPEAFILFGGLTKAGSLLLETTICTYKKMVFENYRNTAQIILSGLKEADAAILGAAALAWTKIEKTK